MYLSHLNFINTIINNIIIRERETVVFQSSQSFFLDPFAKSFEEIV